MSLDSFVPEQMMAEVQERPGLWRSDMSVDRLERLTLWKEVGAVLYKDWESINKATAYDRVLLMQKRWRSYKDAYNRELRRRRGLKQSERLTHRVYIYFENLKFLGGYEGLAEPSRTEFVSGEDAPEDQDEEELKEGAEAAQGAACSADPLTQRQEGRRARARAAKRRRRALEALDLEAPEQVELSSFPMDVPTLPTPDDDDSDKLFLLSFVPEMRRLPPHIKMWARAQVANAMQEAVRCQFSNSMPSTASLSQEHAITIKRQRCSSSE